MNKIDIKKYRVYILAIFSVIFFFSSFYKNGLNVNSIDYEDVEMPLEVYFIDVSQGDSILIKFADEAMLIDGGEKIESKKVINFLKSKNVSKLKYIVATHPHSDHIGGLADIINIFETENIIMPKVTSNSKTFENLVTAIKNNNINVITAKKGYEFKLGESELMILSPISKEYDDLNDYSVVIRMVYKNASFLFTGDAETLVEKEILDNYTSLSADVLKVPHHGSDTSSSIEFLNVVRPTVCVISVGKDNKYNHPKSEIVSRLNLYSKYIYRTDENGDINMYTDGNTIKMTY